MKSLTLALLLALPAFAQKNATIPDADPEAERRSFIVAPGFEVNLFAADPMLAKPIQMNWDADGRLWLACSETYPQIKPGAVANDKIIILEDTKGKGVADKATVFADGLLIPTGVLPGDGGAYVANSTEILHLSSSNPDGKADKRRVVLSGFGTEDTHHIIHTFRWGPDGAMYFNQSVYIHSHVETPHGVERLNGGGIWRYEPKTQKLSVFARGFWNPWGHAFDKFGNSFATDGAGSLGIAHVFPGACFPTGGNQAARVLPGLNPGSPKYCGLEIVSGRHFPDDWQGDCITNDFRGHRVCRFKLRDAGSTFESREMTEVIKSTHPAFRPIDVSIGPDGALYIADWYNPIIQHGEVDFRDPRRDTTHGRIWRVTAKGRGLVEKPKLTAMKVPELFEQLKSPEAWTRNMAKRLLMERSPQMLDDHTRFLSTLKKTDESAHLECMWLGWHDGTLANATLDDVVQSRDLKRRAAALRTITHAMMIDEAVKAAGDPSPALRLAALRWLGIVGSKSAALANRAVMTALKVLDHPMDPTLDYTLWLTLRELEPVWLPELLAGKIDLGDDIKKYSKLIDAAQSPEALKPVIKMLQENRFKDQDSWRLWINVISMGGREEAGHAFQYAMSERATENERNRIFSAIESVGISKNIKPPESVIREGLKKLETSQKLLFIGAWKLESERAHLETYTSKNPEVEWRAAWGSLVRLGGPKSIAYFKRFVQSDVESERFLAISYLAALDVKTAAEHAANFLATSNKPNHDAIVLAFMDRKGGADALTEAISKVRLTADMAKLCVRLSRNNAKLIAAISKAGGLGDITKVATPEDVKSLVTDALAKGDAVRGEAVYRRKELQCVACHAIAGAGGRVGPDLASIGASAQPDYIVEALLLPNKAIKEGYHTLDVVKTDGKLVSGIKVRETPKEIVLRDKDDREVTIALDDIESKKNGRTLMPDGVAVSLTRAEMQDLVKFLTVLGKVGGGYETSKARLVRAFDVIDPTKETLQKIRSTRLAMAAEQPDEFGWLPVTSTVAGFMPWSDVPAFSVWSGSGQQSLLRFKVAATVAGPAVLKFDDAAGLELFVNGKSQAVTTETTVNFTTGDTVLTLVVDRAKAVTPLRVELLDATGSAARVNVVNGK